MLFKTTKNVTDKLLIEILKEITSGTGNARKYVCGDDVWITDGYVAIRYLKSTFPFRLELLKDFDFSATLDSLERSGYEIVKEELRKVNSNSSIVKLCGHSVETHLDLKYMKMFPGCVFWAKDNIGPVKVCTPFEMLIGIILPVRCKW